MVEHYNSALLVVEGKAIINNHVVPKDHFVLLGREGKSLTIEALVDTTMLVLSGNSLNEPIAAHRPFVMNTRAELIEAYEEFRNGKFDHLA